MGTFKATHLLRTDDGSQIECEVLRLEPNFAYGRQAVIRYRDGEDGYSEDDRFRVGMSRLTKIDQRDQFTSP